jgi:molecular chaperone DnaK
MGIPPAPRGMPQVEVTFDIDANGIVNVSAKDKATNKEQQIRIQASGGLSDADVEKMIKDAEANAESDKKKRELVEHRNQAETLIQTAEKNLTEYGSHVSDAERQAIQTAITDLKAARETDDVSLITEKTNTLAQATMKLGEAMYKDQQENASSEQPSNTNQGENIVDADFEEVNENDKKSA